MKKNRMNWYMLAGVVAVLVLGLSLSVPSGTARATAPAAQERHEGFEDMHRAEKLLREARAVLRGHPGITAAIGTRPSRGLMKPSEKFTRQSSITKATIAVNPAGSHITIAGAGGCLRYRKR